MTAPGSGTSVHVVRGTPDDLELAALVAGLVAAARDGGQADEPAGRSAWADRSRGLRGTGSPTGAIGAPGPDRWRWSLRG